MFSLLAVIKSSYSNALTTSSAIFQRPKSADTFYFVAIEVTPSTSGTYTFVAGSGTDTYGCLYNPPFNPSNPSSNLIAIDDDSAGEKNFKFEKHLIANQTIILVVTTYSASQTASFNVTVYGPASVTFRGMFRF